MYKSQGIGPKLTAPDISGMLEHVLDGNLALAEAGEVGTPVCIWGPHGIGKTEMVESYAQSKGWEFAYCAPAQFEEMGDLHGMPGIQGEPGEDARTIFAPPEWVPTAEGPGILLLDDINRADDRILRGLMQLLQNFAMFSWSLPPKWQIVATANPEGCGYSVTPMDEAMLTRMIHMTLTFEPKAWAKWATASGVDTRGIDFVLSYPEVVTGSRTTPRTLVQFFNQLRSIPDLRKEVDLVANLAASILDESTVAAFVSYINEDLGELLTPEEILGAKDNGNWQDKLQSLSKDSKGTLRVDRLSAICTRVFLYVSAEDAELSSREEENLCTFLIDPNLPNDLRFNFVNELKEHKPELNKVLLKNKELATLLLS